MALAIVVALGIGVYLFTQIDSEIRRHVENSLAEHYSGLRVRVDSAQLVRGRGVDIRGLLITDPAVDGPGAELVSIDEIFVQCNTDLQGLLKNALAVQKLIIRRPTLRLAQQADANWNVARLLPLPRFSSQTPVVVIDGGRVEWHQPAQASGDDARPVVLRELHMTLTPRRPASQMAKDRRTLDVRPPFDVQGILHSDFLQQLQFEGTLAPDFNRWQFTGSAEGMEISPKLNRVLPPGIAQHATTLGSLHGQATIQFQVSRDPSLQPPLQFNVAAHLAGGRLENRMLPSKLTDVDVTIRATDQSLTVENLTAQSGTAVLRLSGERVGWGPDAHLSLTADAQKIVLNRELFAALPESFRRVWSEFQPVGEANAALKLSFDGRRWRPEGELQLRNVAFACEKFPYPLERCTGTVQLHDKEVTVDIIGYGGGQPIRIVKPGPRGAKSIHVHGRNIPIDERLIRALRHKERQVVMSLNPTGKFHFDWKCWRDDPKSTQLRKHLVLELDGATIQYDPFPYPLTDVRGIVEAIDRRWHFQDLQGNNDTGRVFMSGNMAPVEGGQRLILDLNAKDVPLEEELYNALNPKARQMWRLLKPHGTINFKADVEHQTGRPLEVKLTIHPIASTTSIEPVAFPYRMEHLEGVVSCENRKVELKHVRARHGDTSITTDGDFHCQEDGSWRLWLKKLNVDRLQTDRDLLTALSPGLRSIVRRLDPTGPISLRGSLNLSQGSERGSAISSVWDLEFDLHQANVDCGIELANVRGGLRLFGESRGKGFGTFGELAIDSLNYQGIQFTDVRGPIWAENRGILLGVSVGREKKLPPRTLTAKLCGGTLVGNGQIAVDGNPRFSVSASLEEGDLSRFTKEAMGSRQPLRGKVYGNVSLQGNGRSMQSLRGSGNIQLREAEIYELPPVLALLKVLLARPPDPRAFTETDMRFTVHNDRVNFDQLDLIGDAITLYGKGNMTFDSKLNLAFHTNFRKRDLPLPWFRGMLGQINQQIMQVHVGGTFEDPEIRTTPFPVMNQAIQQIQTDLDRSSQRQSMLPDPQKWFSKNKPSLQ